MLKKFKTKYKGTLNTYNSAGTIAIISDNEEKIDKIKRRAAFIIPIMMMFITFVCTGICCCEEKDIAASVITDMINIIVKVFRYIGVVLAVYSVGQLIMAFKNEDADSKSRATTLLVVACVLIGLKSIIDGLNLTQYL